MRRRDNEQVGKVNISLLDRRGIMYKDIKKVSRSKGYFIDAIKAANDKENSRYFPEGLELIGVNLDSDFLKMSQVLAEPQITLNLADDTGITIDITLKPESEDDPVLDILKMVIDSTSTGMFMGNARANLMDEAEQAEVNRLSSMMMPKALSANDTDPEVTLFFDEDSVYLQRFKILGEEYYLFSLTEKAILGEDYYEHTLNILLKEKSSSIETFFSSFVGHNLGKRETHRLLESISQNNISGFFVGGLSYVSDKIDSLTYGISNTRMIYQADEGTLTIRTTDTSYIVRLSEVAHSEVKVNGAGKYTVKLNFRGGALLNIFMG